MATVHKRGSTSGHFDPGGGTKFFCDIDTKWCFVTKSHIFTVCAFCDTPDLRSRLGKTNFHFQKIRRRAGIVIFVTHPICGPGWEKPIFSFRKSGEGLASRFLWHARFAVQAGKNQFSVPKIQEKGWLSKNGDTSKTRSDLVINVETDSPVDHKISPKSAHFFVKKGLAESCRFVVQLLANRTTQARFKKTSPTEFRRQ